MIRPALALILLVVPARADWKLVGDVVPVTRLDANLTRLVATNAAIDRSVVSAGGDGMAEAMKILARAVDVLSARIPEPVHPGDHSTARRAA